MKWLPDQQQVLRPSQGLQQSHLQDLAILQLQHSR